MSNSLFTQNLSLWESALWPFGSDQRVTLTELPMISFSFSSYSFFCSMTYCAWTSWSSPKNEFWSHHQMARCLTFINPPQLGPGSVFSSLSSPPTHCIFLTWAGYQTKQGKIGFVLFLRAFVQGQHSCLSFLGKGSQREPWEPSDRDPSGQIPEALSHLGLRS